MIINQRGAVSAYFVFEDIYKQKMRPVTALKVFQLRQELKNQYNFQVEQEKIILEKHHGTIDQSGNIAFNTKEDYTAAEKDMEDLAKQEVSIHADPIDLLKEDILISPENIQQIQPFIIL